MTLPRKTFWLILTAIPTLLITTIASYVLIRFLTVRDRLGTWNLVVHDAKGAEVGHGTLILVATDWTTHWSWIAPFVVFTPTMAEDAGQLILGPSAIGMPLQSFTASHPLSFSRFAPGSIGVAMIDVELAYQFSLAFQVDLKGDMLPPIGTMVGYSWVDGGRLPLALTVQITRPPTH